MSDMTRLIDAMGKGDPAAGAELLPLVYQELRQIARSQMVQERAGHTLQATALVHEAYLRLLNGQPASWEGRRHFFGAAAEAMRRILIDHARKKQALKSGGQRQRVAMDDDLPVVTAAAENTEELLALDDALEAFSRADPNKAELVKLIYFVGLNLEEAAALQGTSRTTAYRHWLYARAWLQDAINGRQ